MRVRLTQPRRSVQEVLDRLRARLSEPEVRALFMGAQASTNLRVGPQHLLDRIVGPELELGADIKDANENLQTLMWLWNVLVQDHENHRTHLSAFDVSRTVTVDSASALVSRRLTEVTWFVRGLDAGGNDPAEFGDEGSACCAGSRKPARS